MWAALNTARFSACSIYFQIHTERTFALLNKVELIFDFVNVLRKVQR